MANEGETITLQAIWRTSVATVTGSQVTKDYYGWKTSYKSPSSSGYTGDWRIFYTDSSNVYLIMDSYVGGGSDEAWSAPTSNPAWSTLMTKISFDSSCGRSRKAAYLLTGSNFSKYVTGNALWAIGSPPLEMYIDSINQVKGTSYSCSSYGGDSYQLNGIQWDGSIPRTLCYGIYCNGFGNNSRRIYLAAPRMIYSSQLWYIDASAECVDNGDSAYGYIRPIVCIPKSGFSDTIYDL